ncbi:hypothetical protein DFH06DRAFT_1166493 [Mycena polygramma]|nr:hypothetical protein DFH06DRAFT_1166493 [Mycena polygramma]
MAAGDDHLKTGPVFACPSIIAVLAHVLSTGRASRHTSGSALAAASTLAPGSSKRRSLNMSLTILACRTGLPICTVRSQFSVRSITAFAPLSTFPAASPSSPAASMWRLSSLTGLPGLPFLGADARSIPTAPAITAGTTPPTKRYLSREERRGRRRGSRLSKHQRHR